MHDIMIFPALHLDHVFHVDHAWHNGFFPCNSGFFPPSVWTMCSVWTMHDSTDSSHIICGPCGAAGPWLTWWILPIHHVGHIWQNGFFPCTTSTMHDRMDSFHVHLGHEWHNGFILHITHCCSLRSCTWAAWMVVMSTGICCAFSISHTIRRMGGG